MEVKLLFCIKLFYIKNIKYKDAIDETDVAYEDEVYLHEGKENWAIKRPIKHGFFNLNKGQETL